ncbi:MerR family transcriptional regulator [Aristophania vespae]|uniref:MerR family transcriptional regulator n=1 Tax=Aristophania vespae TaxID=2697033 RepID=A0A6P1NAM8_9PROT|nr:MerR family transcriptional regulator [Aristophania vespae]QHI95715.1 MerR family transcriptional regulator [Aristophania vespae]UMM63407.1 hypothetical protein DM15PD_03700 [Aristophania vespae]
MSAASDMVQAEQTYSLSEIAEGLGIPTYRLRSWENFYPVFKASRSEDGQSYYTESDISVIQRIAELLYKEGRKSHEIMPILREELGQNISDHKFADSKFKAGEKAPLIEELSKENDHFRQENAALQEKLEEQEHQHQTIQAELSEALSILGQENAKLQTELEEARKYKESFNSAEEEVSRLTTELKCAEELHAHDKDVIAHYNSVEDDNKNLRMRVQELEQHQDLSRAKRQDAEIARLRSGLENILSELSELKKLFVS